MILIKIIKCNTPNSTYVGCTTGYDNFIGQAVKYGMCHLNELDQKWNFYAESPGSFIDIFNISLDIAEFFLS